MDGWMDGRMDGWLLVKVLMRCCLASGNREGKQTAERRKDIKLSTLVILLLDLTWGGDVASAERKGGRCSEG